MRRVAFVVVSFVVLAWVRCGVLGGTLFSEPEHLKPLGLSAPGSRGWRALASRIEPTAGLLYPDQSLRLDLEVVNTGNKALVGEATLEVTAFTTRLDRYEAERGPTPLERQVIGTVVLGRSRRFGLGHLTLGAGERKSLTWRQPDAHDFSRFGAYLVALEVEGLGKQPVATFARIHKPSGSEPEDSPLVARVSERLQLGAQLEALRRLGFHWVHTGHRPNWADVARDPNETPAWHRLDPWVEEFKGRGLWMITNLCGSPAGSICQERRRLGCKVHDERFDERFGAFVEGLVRRYGPPGPLRVIDFWDRPWEWEGGSGWREDAARYRALYRLVYERAHKGNRRIVVGGTSSMANTAEKFFCRPGGERALTNIFDILTDRGVLPHESFGPRFARRAALPAIDTAVWVGGSPALLVAAATHLAAAGYHRFEPAHPEQLWWENGPAGPMPTPSAAAANFFLTFLEGLRFERVVFEDRLPWLYQWGFGARTVFILAGDRSALDPRAVTLYDQGRADGFLTLETIEGKLRAYDLWGNRHEPGSDGRYDLPLSLESVYLEAPDVPVAIATQIISEGRPRQVRPVELFVEDFTQPVRQGTLLNVEVRNVLPREVSGILTIKPRTTIRLQETRIALRVFPGRSRKLSIPIIWAQPNEANVYPVTFRFEGPLGKFERQADLHALTITRGSAAIDGKLDEWSEAIPLYLTAPGVELDLTDVVWRPFARQADLASGLAEVRLMWDKRFLYVAVRNRKKDWKPKPSLSGRNDDAWFGTGPLAHTYVRSPLEALPFEGDCVQLGLRFRAVRLKLPPYGLAPEAMLAVEDTDYEYALWGTPDGGGELWRSNAPTLPLVNFLPRCVPPGYNGRPRGARVAVRRAGADTIYEAALPLSDMPGLRPAPGKTVFLTVALPGSGLWLWRDRCRSNPLSLKPTWRCGPSNDVRWGFVDGK